MCTRKKYCRATPWRDCAYGRSKTAINSILRYTSSHMRSRIVQFAALVALLLQGALGSLAPVAVLCMHNGSCEPAILAAVQPKSCSPKSCCQSQSQQSAAAGPVIAFTPPCDEDCQNCVDISLPDHDLASIDRIVVQVENSSNISHDSIPSAIALVHREPTVPRLLPAPTGLPECMACLHAPIIRSTRLLI